MIIMITGTYTWPDGRRYEGEFKVGVSDGQGARSERIGGRILSFDHFLTTI
jgi:hypothetical protein